MNPATAGHGVHPRVAYQGEPGAFSEAALLRYLDGRARPVPCRDFRGVGEALERGEAEFGLLPVENSLAGSVQGAQDVLLSGRFRVLGETVSRIRHCLLGVPGACAEALRRVISHPVALAQCTHFLARTGLEAVAAHDTAGAARQIAAGGDPGVGAIAARSAAGRYGLEVLAEDLQDRNDNQTRFFLISLAGDRTEEGPGSTEAPGAHEGPFKAVAALELEHRPGALFEALRPFARHRLDLTRIESRPAGDPWRYRFLVELTVPSDPGALKSAVEAVRSGGAGLTVLGSFVPDDRREPGRAFKGQAGVDGFVGRG